jgi:hypothetical protein
VLFYFWLAFRCSCLSISFARHSELSLLCLETSTQQ